MRRRAFLATAMAVSTPLVAGCLGGDGGGSGSGGDSGSDSDGGDGGGDGSSGGSGDGGGGYGGYGGGGGGSTTTAGDGGSGDARSAYPDYDWGKLADASATETTSVTMQSAEFHPLVASVATGAEVAFANEDGGSHTVTIPALDVDEQLSGGASTTLTFGEAGTFDYVCTFHPPGMLGRLVVE